MLIICEKKSLIEPIKKAIKDQLNETDEFISIFGGEEGVKVDIPEGIPNRFSDLKSVIEHDLLDDAASLEVISYFQAKAILGKAGLMFRKFLKSRAKQHEKVVFFVDPDFMLIVANKLIKLMKQEDDKITWLTTSTISLTDDSIKKAMSIALS